MSLERCVTRSPLSARWTVTHLSNPDPYATWSSSPGTLENRPINCVSWYEAYAFCIWDGGFLPSEAEWEYAAAGGSEQREYPWGTAAPTNQYAIYNCNYPSVGTCTSTANIAPVGVTTSGAARWGQLDLAGNVWEWTLDWFGTYTTCTDCVNSVTGTNRTLRGGNYFNPGSALYPEDRNQVSPTTRANDHGFRCARTP